MGINFPLLPTIGTLHPNPAVAGQPQYAWDGVAWKSVVNNTDLYVKKAGDVMTGNLSLPVNVTPAAEHAIRKDYAESAMRVYAAPLDALAYNGMQVNGSMAISQERAYGTAVTITNYVCDGWGQYWTPGIARSSTVFEFAVGSAPTQGNATYLFSSVTTAKPTLITNDLSIIYQHVEASRMSRLAWGSPAAKPLTIGFWVVNARPGIYSVNIQNGDSSRSCAASYTHNVGGAWEYKTITFPGDVGGTWPTNNTRGLIIAFVQAASVSYNTPTPNAWVVGDFRCVAGQVNGVAATSDNFAITGLVVLPGIYAPTAEQSALIVRPYDQELVTCQRYYETVPALSTWGYGATGGTVGFPPKLFSVTKRAAPTIAFTDVVHGNTSALAVVVPTPAGFSCQVTVGTTGSFWTIFGYTADARL